MKHIHTFESFLNEANMDPGRQKVKPMKGLKYEIVKAKDLKVGDELSDGLKQTWEIAKVISVNPIKLEVTETIVPKNHPDYNAPGATLSIDIEPNAEVCKIIR